jgi:hypothetical protein
MRPACRKRAAICKSAVTEGGGAEADGCGRGAALVAQQCLYLRPLPHGQASLRPGAAAFAFEFSRVCIGLNPITR